MAVLWRRLRTPCAPLHFTRRVMVDFRHDYLMSWLRTGRGVYGVSAAVIAADSIHSYNRVPTLNAVRPALHSLALLA